MMGEILVGKDVENAQDEKMTELIQVLDEIKQHAADEIDSAPSETIAAEFLKKLEPIYSDSTFRHSYSIISRNLGSYKADERDSIPVVLGKILEIATKQEEIQENKQILKNLQKLLDHVELECLRLNRMDEIKTLAKISEKQQQGAKEVVDKVAEDAKKLETKVKGFHEQSITILGIFSAIVIGFMSEISLFNKGFETLTPENVYAVLFYCTIVGMIVFNTLFMLIFFVAKIAGFSLAISKPTKQNGVWLKRTLHNYPYIYCFNIFCGFVAVGLFVIGRKL